MLTAAIAFAAVSTPAYRVIDLGIPGICTGMNDRGEIVGHVVGPYEYYGFLWKDGKLTRITPPDDGELTIEDINNEGVAIGTIYDVPDIGDVPFVYTKEKGLKPIPDNRFQPWKISDAGHILGMRGDKELDAWVVGTWKMGSGFTPLWATQNESQNLWGGVVNEAGAVAFHVSSVSAPTYSDVTHLGVRTIREGTESNQLAYRIAKGQSPTMLATELRDPSSVEGRLSTFASAINKQGWVAGCIELVAPPSGPSTAPAPASAGGITQLSAPTRASRNEWSSHPWWFTGAAAIWFPDNTRLQLSPGTHFSDINDSGVAVGGQAGFGFRPLARKDGIIWDRAGGVRNLNHLVPEGSPWLLSATKINNHGEILCRGFKDNTIRWYLLKPA